MEYDIRLKLGVGPLKIGERRRLVRNNIMNEFRRETLRDSPETDFYSDAGVRLGYDRNDELEFIEVMAPGKPTLDGIRFLGRKAGLVLEELKARGMEAQYSIGTYDFRRHCMALYCPGGKKVLAVSIYRFGYYDEIEDVT